MPELHVRGSSFYLLYSLGEEVGPFATLVDAEAWLEWMDSKQSFQLT